MKKNITKEKPEPKVASPVVVNLASIHRTMLIICAACAFLLYINTVTHEYTVDDGTVMENNKIVKKGPSAIGEIFTTSYRKGFWDRSESLYRPMSVAMFAIEWGIAPKNPLPGHIINILLFVVTAAVLFTLLRTMLHAHHPLLPFLITLLFIAHPVHTEVVANIKSRDEILAFLFSISGLLFALRYAQSLNMLNLVYAALCLLVANLSKENALTMVAVVPLTLWFFTKSQTKQIITATLASAAAAAVYFGMRVAAIGSVSNFTDIELINNTLVGAQNMGERLSTAFMLMGKYFLLMFVPHPLSFDYSYSVYKVVSFGNVYALLSTIAIIGLIVYCVINFKKKSPIVYGILFFALTISLVSNIAFLIEATLAERFAYMPSLGFCIAIVFVLAGLIKLNENKKTFSSLGTLLKANNKLVAILGVAFLLFSFKTIHRNTKWKSNMTLLETDVVNYPESARIRYAFGSALIIEKGLKEEKDQSLKEDYMRKGIEQLQKGVELVPTYSDAWYHMGIAYKELKDNKTALECLERAANEKYKKDPEFLIAQGVCYGETKQYDKAFEVLDKAISILPTSSEAYNNKGIYLTDVGRLDEALKLLNKAVELKPDNENAIYNIGNVYAKAGQYKQAIDQYAKAIQLKPDYPDAWNNTGNCYGMMKDFTNALSAYKRLLEINPNNANATNNIGITYMMLGDSVQGKQYVMRARQMMGIK